VNGFIEAPRGLHWLNLHVHFWNLEWRTQYFYGFWLTEFVSWLVATENINRYAFNLICDVLTTASLDSYKMSFVPDW